MFDVNLTLTPEELSGVPHVNGARTFIDGNIDDWEGDIVDVTSPLLDSNGDRIVIGKMAQLTAGEAVKATKAAKRAWNNGTGFWPQLKMDDRIAAILNLVANLKAIREEIVHTLQWEICKNNADAAAEFDRTMLFIDATINAIREMDAREGNYTTVSGVTAKVRRAAVGVMLVMGPFNYPVIYMYIYTYICLYIYKLSL